MQGLDDKLVFKTAIKRKMVLILLLVEVLFYVNSVVRDEAIGRELASESQPLALEEKEAKICLMQNNSVCPDERVGCYFACFANKEG